MQTIGLSTSDDGTSLETDRDRYIHLFPVAQFSLDLMFRKVYFVKERWVT